MKVEGLTETIKIAEIHKGEFASETPPIEVISKTDSFVGYYADIDGDGKVDGIIYADLAVGRSGIWDKSNSATGRYSYDAVTSGLKEYYINGTYTDTYFEERQIIKELDGTTGNDRFYVMSLSDFTTADNTRFCWYYSAYSDCQLSKTGALSVSGGNGFGKGKANTAEMVNAWNNATYGSQNGDGSYPDMWGVIQTKVNEGWFVPSVAEWEAFGDAFKISETSTDETYYSNFGLGTVYWSSTVANNVSAYYPSFSSRYCNTNGVTWNARVRLSTTF